jgi:hypothetical protein
MFKWLKKLFPVSHVNPETIQECNDFLQEREWFSRNGLSGAVTGAQSRSEMNWPLMHIRHSEWFMLKLPHLIEAIDCYFARQGIATDIFPDPRFFRVPRVSKQPRYCRIHNTRHKFSRCGYRNIKRRQKTHRMVQR